MRRVIIHKGWSVDKSVRLTRPSFLVGLSRSLDIGGQFDATPVTGGSNADARALADDWRAVGSDLIAAMNSAVGE
jgi:hypothetical protein